MIHVTAEEIALLSICMIIGALFVGFSYLLGDIQAQHDISQDPSLKYSTGLQPDDTQSATYVPEEHHGTQHVDLSDTSPQVVDTGG